MQRIERYGVIALVFLLVTIMAVALWGQREEQGLLSFMKKGESPQEEVQPPSGKVALPIAGDRRASSRLPINSRPVEAAGRDDRTRASRRNSVATPYVPPSAARGTLPPPPQGGRGAGLRGSPSQATPTSSSVVPAVANAPVRSDAPPAALRKSSESQASKPDQVVVRRGETLSHIAQRELGSAQRWRDILAVNEGLDPRRMHAGIRLNLPAMETTARPPSEPVRAAQPSASRVNGSGSTHSKGYTVKRGDTLSQIALDELGRAGRWKEIVDLNPGLDPERVLAGTRIILPAAPRPTPALALRGEPAPARPREIARATSAGTRVR